MRIVILSTHCPYPPTSGGRIRLGALVMALSGGHDLRLFLLTDETEQNIELVRAKGITVTRAHRTAWDRLSGVRRAVHNLTALLRSTTPIFENVREPGTDARIRSEAADADVFIIDTTSLAPYASSLRRAAPHLRIIINTHDVDSELFGRLAAAASNPVTRIQKRLLAVNTRRRERSFHRHADAVLAVSEADRLTLAKLNRGAVPVFVVPNAVDTEELRPLPPTDSPAIIFCGVLNYQPNVEGIRWFVDQVFPSVRSRVPDAQLLVVGRRPTADILNLAARAGIDVIGEVEDVREYYARSAIAIVPLLTGGGTRLKFLEAMALGRAVVSTSLGAEGIGPCEGLITADDPADFADRVVELLRDGASPMVIKSAVQCVEGQYSQHALGHRIREIVAGL